MPLPHFKNYQSYPPRRPDHRSKLGRPLAGRPRRPAQGLFKKLLPAVLVISGLFVLFSLTAFAWYSRDLPQPDKIIDRSIAQSTKIYDRSGEHLLYEVHGPKRRTIIPLEQIPEYARWATILVEDKNFYTHAGFDLKGIARALYRDIVSLSTAEGGSTLTQQLIKNALLTGEKRLSRKIKELVLAYQIERKFSKDQILQLYFNEIPYGSSAYGIQAASAFYFNKEAKDLSIAESAALAALPRAPTYYSPYGSHTGELHERKNFIISLLQEAGKITAEQAEQAKKEELKFVGRESAFAAPHFVMMVRELLAAEYGDREVEEGGYKVLTSLDFDLQKAAEQAIAGQAQINKDKYNGKNASLAAIDPKSGQILALVGSVDYFDTDNDGNFNVALQGKRQPGSSLKPLVYAVGFEKGYTDKTTLWDVVTNFGAGQGGKPYVPHNYDLKERGPVSVRAALAQSLNIPAVKMLYLAGPGAIVSRAQDFGYTTLTDPSRYGLSLVLGGAEVTLLEHTSAYAVFASEGMRRPASAILKVEDREGRVLREYKDEAAKKVMDAEITREISSILSDNQARAPIFGASNYLTLPDRPVAAKTGTTNDYRDAWTIGYTPQLAAGVWVGNNDFSEMKRGADGSVVAAPIWNAFMRKALSGKPVENFIAPNVNYPDKPVLRGDLASGTPVKIDRASGLLATDLTPPSFIEEKIFRVGHNILHYVNPADPLGPEPDAESRDVQYNAWEEPVQAWQKKNNWTEGAGAIPTEYDNLHVPENRPAISIIEPAPDSTVTGEVVNLRVEAAAKRGISRVEFYIDDQLLATVRSTPYIARYVADTSKANGFHTFKAVAYDDIDNSETVWVNFNVFLLQEIPAGTEPPSAPLFKLNWLSPANDSSVKASDFPLRIKLEMDNTQVSNIEIYAIELGAPSDDDYIFLASVKNPGANLSARWRKPPPDLGKYLIYAEVKDKNNITTRYDGPLVTIE